MLILKVGVTVDDQGEPLNAYWTSPRTTKIMTHEHAILYFGSSNQANFRFERMATAEEGLSYENIHNNR